MFNMALKVARVWGIPIKLHASLVILPIVFAVSFIKVAPGLGWRGVLLGTAQFLPLYALVLVSIALHELGHSFVAIRKGCRVRQITLLFFGGVAQMEQIPHRPRDEFQMAIAGPAVSVLLGCMLYAGSLLLRGATHNLWIAWAARYLLYPVAITNLVLAVFNMVPAFPMDGGRVLRAVLTPRTGRLRATLIASTVGRVAAVLFGFAGWFGLLGPGDGRPNWILIVIAFFIYSAAGNEYRVELMKEARRRHVAGDDPFAGWRPAPPASPNDEVVIGPPPYEQGPGQRTEVRPANEGDPFRHITR